MTGMSRARMTSNSSKPSSPGSMTSRIARSYGTVRASSAARKPSAAVSHAQPATEKFILTSSAMGSSSSTIRIRYDCSIRFPAPFYRRERRCASSRISPASPSVIAKSNEHDSPSGRSAESTGTTSSRFKATLTSFPAS